ncbi:MAG: protein-L-isoaspartate(D-aspartate) O-methyltransferase [Methylococcaceae bacterium]|nr:protein-L-isoaspartate(D-aspartate) O-methyltransferase [Methylococcaceae bacterium]
MNTHLQGSGMTSQRTRERMVTRLEGQGIKNKKVLAVMAKTPRHIFVDEALQSRAYEDTALPIGFNQTISQPYIVARMTELLLEAGPLKRVLEIGTGCGYQTAILAQLVEHVFTVERILPLHDKAKTILRELKIDNISFRHQDGGWGWELKAPFDGILVAAAPTELPAMLLEQMALGAVMVIPIGKYGSQELQRVTRTEDGYDVEELEMVNFVPFLSGKE